MSWQNCKIVAEEVNSLEYHKQEGERGTREYQMSSGKLRDFAWCQSRWVRGWNSPDTEAKRKGSILDCRLLTPAQFFGRYAVRPPTYETTGMQCPVCHSITDSQKCAGCKTARVPVKVTKNWNTNSTHCEEWMAAQEKAGLEVCTQADLDNADAAIKRLFEDDILRSWHEACDKQVWVAGEWCDEKTGLVIPCRCLLDYVPRLDSEFASCAGDLKTTRSAARRPFSRWAQQQGYHIQGAWDLDMLNAAEGTLPGQGRVQWCLILSENFPPWEPGRRFVPVEMIEDARRWYHHALGQYARALATGKWKGYDDHPDAVQGWSLLDYDARGVMYEAAAAMAEDQWDADNDEPAAEEQPQEITP